MALGAPTTDDRLPTADCPLATGATRCQHLRMADFLAGRLLVASPKLVDPTFARSVICVCAHDANGALGVILNRPIAGVDIGEHLPDWAPLLPRNPQPFHGGPVEPEAAIALGLAAAGVPDANWTPVSRRVGLVDLKSHPADLSAEIVALRVFLGYAGWSPGQLEQEVADEAWFVVDELDDDAFTDAPETLWRDVLRRQSGHLAMFAHFPPTPGLN
jgi:putative transcriptional regulator